MNAPGQPEPSEVGAIAGRHWDALQRQAADPRFCALLQAPPGPLQPDTPPVALRIERHEGYVEGFRHGAWYGILLGLVLGCGLVAGAMKLGLVVGS